MNKLVEIARETFLKSEANIVWVGLGAPKQIEFSARIRDEVSGTLITVGAAFDFFAETKKSAPRILSQIGLEWLYRICVEPRRLLSRYGKVMLFIPIIFARFTLGKVYVSAKAGTIE
jgi:N-acetylglucosaminyldiphosphoundecaprenol N-acetyl-beta-D-mannosaminyltransferase